jgi:hypothetical protein
MAADFGINAQIISESGLRVEIEKIAECLRGAGIDLEIDSDQPGLGALIATLVRAIEKAIITAYEPIIALIRVVTEALAAGVRAPIVFIEKITGVVSGLSELLSGLPGSIIEFVISKILEPIVNFIMLPFPSTAALVEILLGRVKLEEIDWNAWLADGRLVIPPKLRQLGDRVVKPVLTLFQSHNGLPPAILKIFELLLFPFKFAIGVLTSVVDKVEGLVKNIFEAIGELLEIGSDPVAWILDFIAGIFATTLLPIVTLFIPAPIGNLALFTEKFRELVVLLFTGGKIDPWLQQLPQPLRGIFDLIIGFIKLLGCFIQWLVGLLSPATILALLGLNGVSVGPPPLEARAWSAAGRSLLIKMDNITPSNLLKLYKANQRIKVKSGNDTATGIIQRVEGSVIITAQPLFSTNRTGSLSIEII